MTTLEEVVSGLMLGILSVAMDVNLFIKEIVVIREVKPVKAMAPRVTVVCLPTCLHLTTQPSPGCHS